MHGRSSAAAPAGGPALQLLDRVTDLLRCVADAGQPVRVTEVATSTGLPLPTASRLLRALADRGLLDRVDRGRYLPASTPDPLLDGVLRVAAPPTAEVLPHLQPLAQPGVGSAAAWILDRRRKVAVCVGCASPPEALRVCFEPGTSSPLWAGAAGIALLATLGGAERDEVRRSAPEAALDQLDRELAAVERTGFAATTGGEGRWVVTTAMAATPPGRPAVAVAVHAPSVVRANVDDAALAGIRSALGGVVEALGR